MSLLVISLILAVLAVANKEYKIYQVIFEFLALVAIVVYFAQHGVT
jgi:hypothetical protein